MKAEKELILKILHENLNLLKVLRGSYTEAINSKKSLEKVLASGTKITTLVNFSTSLYSWLDYDDDGDDDDDEDYGLGVAPNNDATLHLVA